MILQKKKRKATHGKYQRKTQLAERNAIREIGILVSKLALLLMQGLKVLGRRVLLHFHFEIKQQLEDVSNIKLAMVIVLPIITTLMAIKIVTISKFGLVYAILVIAYKLFIAEMDYAAYIKGFRSASGRCIAPPANPHQVWRTVYFITLPLVVLLPVLQLMFPDIITQNVIYLLGGVCALVVGFLQDIICGLVSIFEAQYPEHRPVKYMEV